jgi:hypothetical protein
MLNTLRPTSFLTTSGFQWRKSLENWFGSLVWIFGLELNLERDMDEGRDIEL